jgi:RNA polymerase sigma factor (sigma-70 family)
MEVLTMPMDPRRTPTTEEINEWMRAVASNAARPAFAALFRHFAPRIKGFLVRSGADEALAEELAQEAMSVLWQRAGTFDPARGQVSTWLYTIARNLRIEHHRRQARVAEAPAGGWDADLLPAGMELAPDELLLAAQRERSVRQALAELPAEQARVLQLAFFDEHPHSRIAQDLGIPVGTVKSRIRLALGRLRDTLGGVRS